MKFDIETIEKVPSIVELKKLDSKFNTLAKMQSAFEDIMTCYAKRNSAFAYNQSQSQILRRILEVVPDAKKAFWIYTCLIETILPLNFFSHTLYPQTLLQFTEDLLQDSDREFFQEMGDSIKLFCLKSFYSLFTNMIKNQEITYTILDLLFLFGDPINSKTFFDEETEHQEDEIKTQ